MLIVFIYPSLIIYRWWKGLQSQACVRFARDRVPEMHFWMLGVVHEPRQSYARIALTKCFKLVSLMDDFCDNYSTTEEYEIFITSLERLAKRSIISFILERKLYTSYTV